MLFLITIPEKIRLLYFIQHSGSTSYVVYNTVIIAGSRIQYVGQKIVVENLNSTQIHVHPVQSAGPCLKSNALPARYNNITPTIRLIIDRILTRYRLNKSQYIYRTHFLYVLSFLQYLHITVVTV